MKRKRYSNELKSKVALSAIKGDRTVNKIASEYGIHVSQVNRWKKEAIEMLPDLFGNKAARKSKDIEKEKDRLYQQIGKLQVEVEFLKKTRGTCFECYRKTWPCGGGASKSEYTSAM